MEGHSLRRRAGGGIALALAGAAPGLGGRREADEFGGRCLRKGFSAWRINEVEAPMAEDCLYLNVWRPAKSGRLPVMVMNLCFGAMQVSILIATVFVSILKPRKNLGKNRDRQG